MARNFEVLVESAYLPRSEGEELLNGQPTGQHLWAREAYYAGEVVSEDDLAPDYVQMYDDGKGGVRQHIRETDEEPTRTGPPRAAAGNVQVSSEIIPPQSAVQGEGPPPGYDNLRADEIKEQVSGWELPQLRGALEVELAKGAESRTTVVSRLQEEIERKEAT